MAQKNMVEVARTYDSFFVEGDSCAAEKALERRHVECMGELVDALGRDDFDKVKSLVHDDVTLTILAPTEVPFVRKAEGIEDFVDACRGNYAMLSEMKTTVRTVVAQGDVVLCVLRDEGRFEDGATYDLYSTQELTFREGKLARVWEVIAPVPRNE